MIGVDFLSKQTQHSSSTLRHFLEQLNQVQILFLLFLMLAWLDCINFSLFFCDQVPSRKMLESNQMQGFFNSIFVLRLVRLDDTRSNHHTIYHKSNFWNFCCEKQIMADQKMKWGVQTSQKIGKYLKILQKNY